MSYERKERRERRSEAESLARMDEEQHRTQEIEREKERDMVSPSVEFSRTFRYETNGPTQTNVVVVVIRFITRSDKVPLLPEIPRKLRQSLVQERDSKNKKK